MRNTHMGTSHARPDGCQHLLQRHCVWAWRRWLAGGEPREVLLRGREHGLQHCRGKRRERSRCSVAHRFWMPGMRATRSKTVHVYCAMIADSAARPAARATTRSVSRLSRRSPGPGQFIHMSGGKLQPVDESCLQSHRPPFAAALLAALAAAAPWQVAPFLLGDYAASVPSVTECDRVPWRRAAASRTARTSASLAC